MFIPAGMRYAGWSTSFYVGRETAGREGVNWLSDNKYILQTSWCQQPSNHNRHFTTSTTLHTKGPKLPFFNHCTAMYKLRRWGDVWGGETCATCSWLWKTNSNLVCRHEFAVHWNLVCQLRHLSPSRKVREGLDLADVISQRAWDADQSDPTVHFKTVATPWL